MSDLGVCKSIEILKNQSTFIGGQADWEQIDLKIESLKSEIKQTEDMEQCRTLQQRITRLNSGVAIIKVGAPTEVEMIEKKHRVEDALEAVRSAQAEGIVPGGGTALVMCQGFEIDAENEDQALGANILKTALLCPLRQLALNTDQSFDLIIHKIENTNLGWDFKENKTADMIESGIVDPAKVTRVALQNAVSVASTLITTSNAIIEKNP
jgi:chaperonin GroEL